MPQEAAEQATVRHALAQGYLTQEQVREAQLLREQLLQRGQAADLLSVLRARHMRPEQVEELGRVYRRALGAGLGAGGSQGGDTILTPPPVGAAETVGASGSNRQWVQDTYVNNYSRAPTNGSARVSPATPRRVIRGGSWTYHAGFSRSARRAWSSPGDRRRTLGFRAARSLEP